MDPAWMLPSLVDQNPLVWMAKVNGALADLRRTGTKMIRCRRSKFLIGMNRSMKLSTAWRLKSRGGCAQRASLPRLGDAGGNVYAAPGTAESAAPARGSTAFYGRNEI